MTIDFKPVSDILGVEVVGYDPDAAADETTAAAIREAFARHHLLLFRGREFSEEQQIALCRLVGVISSRGGKGYAKADRLASFVSNVHDDGIFREGELSFHSDLTFMEHPLKGRSLHALVLPSEGGDTLFANVELAYEKLPQELRERIAGKSARHAITYEKNGQTFVDEFVRPMIDRHPESGRPVLMVSRAVTKEILGMERPEFRALLKEIWAHIDQPQFVYRHKWRMHDLLLWDNISLQHARTHFDPAEKRALRAVSVDSEAVARQTAA